MSWSQFHERNALMATLIERAATDAEAALDLGAAELAEVQRLFGDVEGLLLALRHRWVTALAAKMDQAAYEDMPVEVARAELAAARPGLRALLDVAARRSVRLRSLERGEQRILDVYTAPAGDDRQTVA